MLSKVGFIEEAFEMADNLIVVVDPQGKILFFNERAQEKTGYREHEVLGKIWAETFVPRQYRDWFQESHREIMQGNPRARFAEYPILKRNGEQIPIT